MPHEAADPILVTGASSGIGAAIADALVTGGHTVYATARRPGTLRSLAAAGATPLELDVTSEESMTAAVRRVEEDHGRVGTLVNNAGYGEYGTIEESDLGAVRAMFETNVFGLARMTQLVLPAMRKAGSGRIINIGSMGGRITFPVGGYYHASKYAVEAISDALRNEVRRFGIQVVLVEPGLIRTNFDTVALGSEAAVAQPDSPYEALLTSNATSTAASYEHRLMSAPPAVVARTVLRAVEARRPRSRYVVTPLAKTLVHARRLGGDRVWDAIIGRQFDL